MKPTSSSKTGESEIIPPAATRRVVQTAVTWQAPILPPEILKKYDEVVPNGSTRLFEQFESEAKHRREMESTSLRYQGRDLQQGKWNALLFGFGVLSVMAFAIWKDTGWVAAVLGGGLLTVIAVTFHRIFGDNQNKDDTKPK